MEGSDPSAMYVSCLVLHPRASLTRRYLPRRTVPFYWPLSQWEDAENNWERILVNAERRRTKPSASPSNAPGDATVGTSTSSCNKIPPRLSIQSLEPGGLLTEAGSTCLWHRVASCPANAEESGAEASTTDEEELDVDGDSRAPTPWPESWYERGSELGLQRFAAEVIAQCRGNHRDAENDNSELGTAQYSLGNDVGHHNRHEHTGGRITTGASSPSGRTAHAGGQPSGGHPTKRLRTGGDGGNEEDRPPKRREANGPPDRNANLGKFYACPYQKRNPQQSPFCGMPHGSKRGVGWSTVSRIK